MGDSFKIGDQKFNKSNMPSDFQIQDVKSKTMQRILNLFDVNGDGIISKDEAAKISLFYKTGSATFSKTENGEITDYTISAKKAGENPIETRTDIVDKNDNLVYTETTKYNRKVKEEQTDQYRYKHNADGSVEQTHDTINSKDRLIKTEDSKIDSNGNWSLKNTLNYSTTRNSNEVNVTKTNHVNGTIEDYKYLSE